MKTQFAYFTGFVLLFFILHSCSSTTDVQNNTSKITFKVKTNSDKTDSVIFTGNEIKCYNESTHEICFTDSTTLKTLSKYRQFTCYLNADSLFYITQTSDVMSSIVNDLVLNHSLYEGKYYFDDGYPAWIDNIGATTLRAQNKEKRANAWGKFIEELKLEGKLKK